MNVREKGLTFRFPDGWAVAKYDTWEYYRQHFIKCRDGLKAIDFVAVDPSDTVWLIEVKDYRLHPRTKTVDLAPEMVGKVVDTLAALLPAGVHATVADEAEVARRALHSRSIRVVLHLEQPEEQPPLPFRAINLLDVQQKLRMRLRAIDPNPVVVEMKNMAALPWSVTPA